MNDFSKAELAIIDFSLREVSLLVKDKEIQAYLKVVADKVKASIKEKEEFESSAKKLIQRIKAGEV